LLEPDKTIVPVDAFDRLFAETPLRSAPPAADGALCQKLGAERP
jgi:hypothetical protein